MPFFKVLKKAFQWIDECKEALAKLKEFLTKPPLLSPLVMGEKLYLYLVVTNTAVSSALIREEENVQKSVYYTNQAFQGVEANYPMMEKIAFALLVASRKLHRRNDKATNKEDDEQDRCSRTTHSMGN